MPVPLGRPPFLPFSRAISCIRSSPSFSRRALTDSESYRLFATPMFSGQNRTGVWSLGRQETETPRSRLSFWFRPSRRHLGYLGASVSIGSPVGYRKRAGSIPCCGSPRIARHPGSDGSALADLGLHCHGRYFVGISAAVLNGCGRLDIAHGGYCRRIQHRPRVQPSRWFPAGAKWVLSVCMIAGRLEFYSALVLVTPRFWLR